jgi:hypothetical protein
VRRFIPGGWALALSVAACEGMRGLLTLQQGLAVAITFASRKDFGPVNMTKSETPCRYSISELGPGAHGSLSAPH